MALSEWDVSKLDYSSLFHATCWYEYCWNIGWSFANALSLSPLPFEQNVFSFIPFGLIARVSQTHFESSHSHDTMNDFPFWSSNNSLILKFLEFRIYSLRMLYIIRWPRVLSRLEQFWADVQSIWAEHLSRAFELNIRAEQ